MKHPLTMDDVYRHRLELRIVPMSDIEMFTHLIRFIRTFTDPGPHRSKFIKLTKEKYG